MLLASGFLRTSFPEGSKFFFISHILTRTEGAEPTLRVRGQLFPPCKTYVTGTHHLCLSKPVSHPGSNEPELPRGHAGSALPFSNILSLLPSLFFTNLWR